MRFGLHSVFILIVGAISLSAHAAETTLPASGVAATSSVQAGAPVSVTDPDAEKVVYIEAQEVKSQKSSGMEAHGNVELQQGKQKIFADHVYYDQETGDLSAFGAVRIEQPSSKMAGPDLKMNMKTNIGIMNTPTFQLDGVSTGSIKQSSAHGSAKLIRSTSKTNYEYEDASYTTCPADRDDWFLNVSKLEIDRSTQIGTAHHAWIEFKGVPMLYTPWMDFPLDGRRLSGFLSPTYGNTSSSGVELTVPYYINIAPNYDATVSPRVMSKRGTLIGNEFRYLGKNHSGQLLYDELQKDKITNTSRSRTMLRHSQNLGGGFSFNGTYHQVSDDDFYRDLANSVYNGTQTQLLNEAAINYGGGWWSASLRGQTYQTLQDPSRSIGIPYERLPQLTASAQKITTAGAFTVVSEYVDFRHPTSVNGQRIVAYPSFTYNLLTDPGYYLKPKLGIHHTQYNMSENNSSNIPNTVRTLPIFSVDGALTFEREFGLGDGDYIQTLEPRLFYVKIPYENQSFLPVYDTSQAPFSFAQMFTENRFFGNDRVGDANMTTVAITSRLIDNNGGAERLRVTVGERFSYETPQVNLVTSSANSRSDILVAVTGRVTNALTLDGLLQHDPNTERTLSYNGTARYKPETGKVLNLGYRYTYVDGTIEKDVRQGDFSAQWPIWGRWNAVTRWTYSFNENRILEQLGGLEYNQSCWMVRLVAQKFPVPGKHVSTGLFLQLELRDLVAVGSDPLGALRTSIPGYSKVGPPSTEKPTQDLP